jgi:predicted site-specific integrase-resolvase
VCVRFEEVLSSSDNSVQMCSTLALKLSQYAKQQATRYRTALRGFRAGLSTGYQAPTGTTIVSAGQTTPAAPPEQVASAAHVSPPAQRDTLERQAALRADYGVARGYQVAHVVHVVHERASEVHVSRPPLLALRSETRLSRSVVEPREPTAPLRLALPGGAAAHTGAAHCGGAPGRARSRGRARRSIWWPASRRARRGSPASGGRSARRSASRRNGEKRGPKTMQLVAQHVIRAADPRYLAVDRAAFASKHRYHAANSIVRQSFIHAGVYLNCAAIFHLIKEHEAYCALPRKGSNEVLRRLEHDWHACFAARAAWNADPAKFLRRPLARLQGQAEGPQSAAL